MFTFTQGAELMRIGQRNVAAAKSKLESLDIPVVSEDTGGNYGRTVELDSESGMLLIRTIGYGTNKYERGLTNGLHAQNAVYNGCFCCDCNRNNHYNNGYDLKAICVRMTAGMILFFAAGVLLERL